MIVEFRLVPFAFWKTYHPCLCFNIRVQSRPQGFGRPSSLLQAWSPVFQKYLRRLCSAAIEFAKLDETKLLKVVLGHWGAEMNREETMCRRGPSVKTAVFALQTRKAEESACRLYVAAQQGNVPNWGHKHDIETINIRDGEQ